jgi:integrase
MARQVNRLTAVAISKLKTAGYHPDGAGLYLQLSTAGTKSWIVRYTLAGRPREMGLGSATVVTLAEARTRAQDARKLASEGVDPIDQRTAERRAQVATAARGRTFAEVSADYVEAHRAGWKNAKHAAQWKATLDTYAGPVLGAMTVDAIATEHVLKVLEPIWTEKHETATRLRGRIENVLDAAKVRGLRDGENPARWRGHLDKLLPRISKKATVEHHAALPYAEIKTFTRDLRAQEGVAARALEFAILTAARTGEVIGARWEEIDLGARLWTIPAARMKAKAEHRVPLSPRALAILRTLAKARQGDYVFPGMREGRPLSNMAMLVLLERMGRGAITVHGFRSTFRDWAAETTAHPHEVVEMALAHVIANKAEAAYRRGDLFKKRRLLMDEWARACG